MAACSNGHELGDGDIFCDVCGVDARVTCVDGHKSPPGARFCEACGVSITLAATSTSSTTALTAESAAVAPADDDTTALMSEVPPAAPGYGPEESGGAEFGQHNPEVNDEEGASDGSSILDGPETLPTQSIGNPTLETPTAEDLQATSPLPLPRSGASGHLGAPS